MQGNANLYPHPDPVVTGWPDRQPGLVRKICPSERIEFVSEFSYPNFPTGYGYLTERIRSQYIEAAVASGTLPQNAHRIPEIVSLSASNNAAKPIQFWQLFSVLGPDRIVAIVRNFYERMYDDEDWVRSVFARIGGVNHHVNTQAAMWLDVMGAGPAYHGGEFRLSFHHTHNAIQLMNEKGAKRWVRLMVEALDESEDHMTADARVRPGINTFLTHFFGRYASEFNFANRETFGDINPPVRRKVNFMNMTADAIAAMPEGELKEALAGRGVDVSNYRDKEELVNKALSL
jgi:truncated hemoglobin YjbI